MKRFFAFLFVLTLLSTVLTVLPVTAITAGELEYTLSGNNATITRCYATTSEYTIPSTVDGYPVTALAKGFIRSNTAVRTLTIPASVTYIANQCFRDHAPATVIFAPGSNPHLDGSTFYLANGLNKVVLAEGMESLCYQMFRTTSVTDVQLPSTLKTIGDEAFYGCTSLKTITIPPSVETVGNRAFYSDTGLTNHIVFSEKCRTIGMGAFLNCTSLTSISIMNAACEIADNAFELCNALTVYGRKNSTAYTMCQNASYLYFSCATEEDHVFSGKWETIVVPTEYCYGLAMQRCENCGTSYRRVMQKTKPVAPSDGKYVSGEDWENCFQDVSDTAWYRKAVGFVLANKLFTGTAETLFSPDTEMTRGMFVTVLWRIVGSPKPVSAAAFADVAEGKYYTDAAAWASESGIAIGSNGCFAPDGTLTREQTTVMLYRYLVKEGKDVSARAALDGYSDGLRVSLFAKNAVSYAVATGLLQGSDGALSPQGSTSRAQAATILYRLFLPQ